MFDVLIIGKGLFGCAAARYLGREPLSVAVLGPDEPAPGAAPPLVFASHYDQGRLTGHFGRSDTWSALARLSIAQYPALEAGSGIRFHSPVGRLHAPAARVAPAARETAACQVLTPEEAAHLFPMLRFPGAAGILWEKAPAGYINPRALIVAQLAMAAAAGVTILRQTATAVIPARDYLRVQTAGGESYRARRVLLATGAFSNSLDLLPEPLPLRIKSETILLAEVPAEEAARLRALPAVDYTIDSEVLDDIYLLPPLRYPDGRFYAKLGCNTAADCYFDDPGALRAWFISGDSDEHAGEMLAALQAILPDLRIIACTTGRCAVTYTHHGHPYIDEILPGRLYVCVGGNGTGAKSSDAIGRLAASLVAHGRFPSIGAWGHPATTFTRQAFRV